MMDAQCVSERVRHDIYPRRITFPGLTKQAAEPALDLQQHRFHVFARAQSVDSKIDAITRELPLAHTPDLDRITQAAPALHAEIREYRVARIDIRDREGFFARAKPAPFDLVPIGCAPVIRWGKCGRGVVFPFCCHPVMLKPLSAVST